MPDLNPEKQQILEAKGNVLVTANPGTGKTRLLANKFLSAVKQGLSPDQILCLTFTEKAKVEMENRIFKLLKENEIVFNPSKLQIFTFHSYALDKITQNSIVSSNLLRFTIYEYLIDNNVYNYPQSYIISDVIPKIENLISYLKTFGITLDKIDIEKAKSLLQDDDRMSLIEKQKYADEFYQIFKRYEEIKGAHDVDYADLLINFLALRKIPKYELVLVDELQDVNRMEAQIALKSAKCFFAVGDKKQAIFGFQGGSIKNFESFTENSTQFILSDNFRSTNQILNYSREYFISKTQDESHRMELEKLKSHDNKSGEIPQIYEVDSKLIPSAVRHLLVENLDEDKSIVIIARTNGRLMSIANELSSHGISFSSTYLASSSDAKTNIIRFLKGMFSNDITDIKRSMVTPFAPISLQDSFGIFDTRDLTIEMLNDLAPSFMQLRASIQNVEDVNRTFRNIIIPISTRYGKEYVSPANKLLNSFQEAVSVLPDLTLNNVLVYLESTDLSSDEIELETQVTLSTVHKAKGKEYDTVIYIPTTTERNKSNYQDEVVEAILKTNDLEIQEELEEETLRINFVAFTRAKSKLIIIAQNKSEFANDYAEEGSLEVAESKPEEYSESRSKAISLFLHDDIDSARKLLKETDKWLIDFVSFHFSQLNRLSYSLINNTPFEYLERVILGISAGSPAMTTGSDVHSLAERIINKETIEDSEELILYKNNIETLLAPILDEYPDVHSLELKYTIQLSEIIPNDHNITFAFKTDAIFRNGDKYLIVDWKTDRDNGRASNHRQQLDAYKRAFCVHEGVDPEAVKVGIGYVSLRDRIDTGRFDCLFDNNQPRKTAFDTFCKKVSRILSWKQDPYLFFEELINEAKHDDVLWRSIVEQYDSEIR